MAVAALTWVKTPGSKQYTARTAAGLFRLVRQNTAAGAKRWRATVERAGTTYRIADTDYLTEAKAACAARWDWGAP